VCAVCVCVVCACGVWVCVWCVWCVCVGVCVCVVCVCVFLCVSGSVSSIMKVYVRRGTLKGTKKTGIYETVILNL